MHQRCIRQTYCQTLFQALRPHERPHSSTPGRRRSYSAAPYLSQSSSTRPAASSPPTTMSTRTDPFALLSLQLKTLRTSLLSMLASGHPAITEITKYYFLHPSKQVRPAIVLLFAKATNGLGGSWQRKLDEARRDGAEALDRPLTRPDVLNDWNPLMPDQTMNFEQTWNLKASARNKSSNSQPHPLASNLYSSESITGSSLFDSPLSHTILPTQLRLAQIVEMLHTASLLHDDVIDTSSLRRGAPSAPAAFGNKLSVLGGNFVLGRASAALARLGEEEVTQLIAGVISNLVEGEILQMKDVKLQDMALSSGSDTQPATAEAEKEAGEMRLTSKDAWNIYLQKTYLKTASLMAKGARSAVVLGGCKEGEPWKEIAYAYGRNLGIAFQLVDDVLDYASASATLGKPGGADLSLGLATGPALYAWEEHPEMGTLIGRKFKENGDVEMARDLVLRSSGVQRTRALAQAYADKAREVLQELPESEAKEGLEVLTEKVIGRKS